MKPQRLTFIMGHSSKDIPAESIEAHDEDLRSGLATTQASRRCKHRVSGVFAV